MLIRHAFAPAGIVLALAIMGLAQQAKAQAPDTRHLCSEKYRAAKSAGSLGEETWPQFYSRCASEAKQAQPAAEMAAPAPLDIRHICSEKYQAAKAAGTLGGESWPQFYSRCTAETKANPPTAAPAAASRAAPAAEAPAPAPAPMAAPPAPVVAAPPAAQEPPPPAVAQVPPPAPAPAPVKPNPLKKPAAPPPPAAAPAPSTAVFPAAIAPKYASEKPAKARLKTCSDQYQANKATNANGGLRWVQKGDGYWPECNKRLKGG